MACYPIIARSTRFLNGSAAEDPGANIVPTLDVLLCLAIAQSSASRNIAALSRWHSFGKDGHNLVEAREDPRERRRKIVSLTPRGHHLVATLRALVAGRTAPSPCETSNITRPASRDRREVPLDLASTTPSR
jgi:DNA-binding MarR family transcriptional regulator